LYVTRREILLVEGCGKRAKFGVAGGNPRCGRFLLLNKVWRTISSRVLAANIPVESMVGGTIFHRE